MEQNRSKDLAEIVSELIKQLQHKPQEDLSEQYAEIMDSHSTNSKLESPSVQSKGSVFDRLMSDAYRKQKPIEEGEKITVVRREKGSMTQRVEDKLIAHKKHRDNLLLQERFKKHSKIMSELNTSKKTLVEQ